MAISASSESAMAGEQQNMPTILLVQGSFHIPQVYEKLVKGLRDQGYPTIHPRLPSCSDVEKSDFPQVSLVDDVLAIRSELIRQVEYEEKDVVVVMHSYGGLVGSEAVTEELSYAKRQSQGLVGGVTHLFYYAAFLLDKGQSVLSAFGENPNNDVRVSMLDTCFGKPTLRDLQPDGRFCILRGEQTLYNDLPSSEASLWASRLIPQSYQVQTVKLKRTAAWHYIPSTYLICENDQAAPPAFQETFAASAKAQIERCDSGHSPHLSQPQMLIQKICEASQRAAAGSDAAV